MFIIRQLRKNVYFFYKPSVIAKLKNGRSGIMALAKGWLVMCSVIVLNTEISAVQTLQQNGFLFRFIDHT